ncbi:MAG TPA: hypothetical protein VHN13_22360, partial [Candidatus Tectomicrobia bacterium]|nr:hypothetical protein [Candidatus Tectomicrobia bacterium]
QAGYPKAALMRVCGRCRRWGLLSHASGLPHLSPQVFYHRRPGAQVVEEIQRYREPFGINSLVCRMALPVGLMAASCAPCACSASVSPRISMPSEG